MVVFCQLMAFLFIFAKAKYKVLYLYIHLKTTITLYTPENFKVIGLKSDLNCKRDFETHENIIPWSKLTTMMINLGFLMHSLFSVLFTTNLTHVWSNYEWSQIIVYNHALRNNKLRHVNATRS